MKSPNLTSETIYLYIGHESNEQCPMCNAVLYTSKIGNSWCTFCAWSNDESLTEFLVELGKPKIDKPLNTRWLKGW